MLQKPFIGEFSITQKFGERPDYYKQFGFNGHEGLDWGVPTETAIIASEAGTIVRRNDDFKNNAYGTYVVVWHKALNLATWYCHLQSVSVNIGDEVQKGQQIGVSDNTGNTFGPHLHFNVCKTDANGYRTNQDNGYKGFVDPLPYLDSNVSGAQPSEALTECLRLHGQLIDEIEKTLKPRIQTLEQQLRDATQAADGVSTSLKTYQQIIQQYATTLGCEADPVKIAGKISELVTVEDQLRKATNENNSIKLELTESQKSLESARASFQTQAIELVGKKQEIESLTSKLAEYEQVEHVRVIYNLFGLLIAVYQKPKEVKEP